MAQNDGLNPFISEMGENSVKMCIIEVSPTTNLYE